MDNIAYSHARKIITKIFRVQDSLPSYQAFMKVLRNWTSELLLIVVPHFRSRMQEELPDHDQVAGFVVLAVDGSRIELPRTRSNQEHFSAGRRLQQKPKAGKPAGKNSSGAAAKPKKKRSPRTPAQKQQAARNRTAKKQRASGKRRPKPNSRRPPGRSVRSTPIRKCG